MSASLLLTLTLLSFAMTPVPLHGASSNTRSTRPKGRSIQSDGGVELKGVRWRSAFTTRTGSYGNQCIERTQDFRELSPVVVTHHGVRAPHALQVSDEARQPFLLKFVREDLPGVAHQRGDVRGLSSGRGGHVEHSLAVLRRERHARQKTRRRLKHVGVELKGVRWSSKATRSGIESEGWAERCADKSP
eukprot:31463-Pelagococcus_subviridis.AAC.7